MRPQRAFLDIAAHHKYTDDEFNKKKTTTNKQINKVKANKTKPVGYEKWLNV